MPCLGYELQSEAERKDAAKGTKFKCTCHSHSLKAMKLGALCFASLSLRFCRFREYIRWRQEVNVSCLDPLSLRSASERHVQQKRYRMRPCKSTERHNLFHSGTAFWHLMTIVTGAQLFQ